MKRFVTLLLICMTSLALLACGKQTTSSEDYTEGMLPGTNDGVETSNGICVAASAFYQENVVNYCANDRIYSGVDELGQPKLLCNDPICTHNNEECSAHLDYVNVSFICKDKRYIIAAEDNFVENNENIIISKMNSAIYCSNVNGDGRGKILEFGTRINDASNIVMKDNFLYFWGFDEEKIIYTETPTGLIETENMYDFSLYSYDVCNNKMSKLLSINQINMIPEMTFICGDTSIYSVYTIHKGSVENPQIEQKVFRIKDNQCDVIKSDENVFIEYIGAINDDLIFYYNVVYRDGGMDQIYCLDSSGVREIMPIGDSHDIQVCGSNIVISTCIDKNDYKKGDIVAFYDANGNEVYNIQLDGKALIIEAALSNKIFYAIWDYNNKDSLKKVFEIDLSDMKDFDKTENLVWTKIISE